MIEDDQDMSDQDKLLGHSSSYQVFPYRSCPHMLTASKIRRCDLCGITCKNKKRNYEFYAKHRFIFLLEIFKLFLLLVIYEINFRTRKDEQKGSWA